MNREIKFRVWMKPTYYRTQEMIYLSDYEDEREGYFINGNRVFSTDYDYYAGVTISEVENPIIMQYTGLKDKNGKDIYEGDIIEWPNGGIYGTTKMEMQMCGQSWMPNITENSKIIGNIYEHIKLLE